MPDKDDRKHPKIFDRLLDQRIILLSEPVMPEPAERIIAQLLYLDAVDSKKPIRMFINSPGGSISDGFAIFDTARAIGAPLKTICTGMSASMGTILMLAPKEKKDRVCLRNTRFMIHQPSGGYRGAAADIEIGAREILKTRDRLVEIYAEAGIDSDRVRADMNRDYWMDANEAIDYGLVDRIVDSVNDV